MSETSVGGRFVSNPRNHSGYDAIFTYVTQLVDGNWYFFLSPRAYYRHRITTGLPFEQRRIACLVGTNRVGVNRRLRFRTGFHSNAVERFLPEGFAEGFVREVANIAARG